MIRRSGWRWSSGRFTTETAPDRRDPGTDLACATAAMTDDIPLLSSVNSAIADLLFGKNHLG
jgi:hypothetical protein